MDDPTYRSHVKKLYPELQLLFRAGESVADVRAHPGWAVVQGLLRTEIAHLDRKLDGTTVLSQAEYAHLHGQRRGLKAAEAAASTLEALYVEQLEEQKRKHEGAGESGPER